MGQMRTPLLPCSNGVVEMDSGSLTFRPGRPDDYIKKFCPVHWEGPGTPAPTWRKSLLEIQNDNLENVAYLQRLFGYAISGLAIEHVFPVFWGPGRNGKSLILETLAYVLGPLAGPIQAELLMLQKHPRAAAAPSPDLMALRGLRLAWASESDEGRRLNAGRVKWICGGDSLTARGPYDRKMVTFRPTHQIFLLTNFRPTGNPQDEALWARIHSVNFPIRFVDDPTKENERLRNPDLPDELKKEGPGILAWLVEGYYSWREIGLSPPSSVLADTTEYRQSEDSIGHFLNEICTIEEGLFARAQKLHDSYTSFCESEGFKPVGKRKFFKTLAAEFKKDRDKIGNYYCGLSVKDQDLKLV
jgi:putative DNA primase/helicase